MIANALVALVAALHLYFLVLEMFLWTKPAGLKAFGLTPEKAADSAVLAANQGFIMASSPPASSGGWFQGNPAFAFQIKLFFLALRHRRRRLWRRQRQPEDPVRAGRCPPRSH